MSDLVNISDFSYSKGLNLGKDNQSFTYLYGLSDFWQYLFEDTTPTNLLLETTSVQASDIYSNFLQLTAGLSIDDIGPSASSQLRLEIVSSQLNLPNNIHILSASWANNFITIEVDNSSQFFVGDTIMVSGVKNSIIYDVGNGINVQPIAKGGDSYPISGALWNGTFTITSITIGGFITYYQPVNPGPYTGGGVISTTSIGTETYQLQESVNTTRFIANRAFLPTIVLEDNVDYVINPDTLRISFAQPLASYGFPTRLTSTGATEYSLWFVDVTYDEDLIYEHFPLLLGLTKPQISNEPYRNFLYGLYYIYTSGPSLTVVEKGINLVLGIPLARNNETVLDVRPYLGTDQFLIITDMNSYVIPAGLTPTVTAGDTLSVGDELSKWVEIKDYESDGAWWQDYTVDIPPELMPILPSGLSRTVGGLTYFPGYDAGDGINENAIDDEGISNPYTIDNYADWIMQNYLRYNVFLVKVNVTSNAFLAAQQFESVADLLYKLKPSHTYPLYSYHTGYSLPTRGVIASLVPGIFNTSLLNVALLGSSIFSSVGTIQGGRSLDPNIATFLIGSISAITDGVGLSGVTATGIIRSVSFSISLTSVSTSTSISSVAFAVSDNIDLVAVYTVPGITGEIAAGQVMNPGVSTTNSISNVGMNIEVTLLPVTLNILLGELNPYPARLLNGTWQLDGTIPLGSRNEVNIAIPIIAVTSTDMVGTIIAVIT